MKDGEGITKAHLCITHGQGQGYEDCLREGRGWGWVEVGKGRESRDNCNSINNKKKIQKGKFMMAGERWKN